MQAGRLLGASIRLAQLPSLAPVDPDVTTTRAWNTVADELLAGRSCDLPSPRLDFLRWLAQTRGVLFHGSPRDDLTELRPVRLSSDAREFGDRQAVYASTDPVWAIYFACLRRGDGFRQTRNGTLGRAEGPLYPRSYFFSHNRGAADDGRFGPGSLYVLSPDGFEAEPPLGGVFDTAHLVSKEPVTPLARLDVTPRDFPFVRRVTHHRVREPIFVTFLRRR